MAFEFKITRRVEFSDTDMEGIMHFSNFFRFIETAEHAFFRSFGHSVVLSRSGLDVSLPRVHAQCDYLAPLHFEDEVQIHLLVERKGTSSLTYQVRFTRLGPDPAEVARARLVVVCARKGPEGLQAVPLPEVIRANIQEAPAHLLSEPAGNAKKDLSVVAAG